MKIGVIGLNGRMSQAVIAEINKNPDCVFAGSLVRKADKENHLPQYEDILDLANNSDAIVDFSNPQTSVEIAKKLADKKIILVCGTTGFTPNEFEILQQAAKKITLIYSANMSLGINLLQKMIKQIAPFLTNFDSSILDIHHKHKKDSPSGTALMLKDVIEKSSVNATKQTQIASFRIGAFPGEHQVMFSSEDEVITLSHQAFNRNIFAQGAIKACFWGKNALPGKIYSMENILS